MFEVPSDCTEYDNVVVRDASDKAIKVELDDGEQVWVPRSVIADESEVYEEGTEGRFVVKTWWAERKGLA